MKVLVTGGAGFVGSVLVPKLLRAGHEVTVLDWFLYGDEVLDAVKNDSRLTLQKGDLRRSSDLARALSGQEAVIHLACISNDPSFDLEPSLGKSVNYDGTIRLFDAAKAAGIQRFVYASSSSVYGVKDEPEVTEELSLTPLTDYSKYKAMCEEYLLPMHSEDFTVLILRPATVCGYSPRLRLDVVVNALAAHALAEGVITVDGGAQVRPNLHIEDMTDLYVQTLVFPTEKIGGKIFNVGYQNLPVQEIAEMVQRVVKRSTEIIVKPVRDARSYRVSSKKILHELSFAPRHTVEEAIQDLQKAFESGRIPNALTDDRYYNIRRMQSRIRDLVQV